LAPGRNGARWRHGPGRWAAQQRWRQKRHGRPRSWNGGPDATW